ncbi:MAG TPA: acyl-[acyl-carrier-protein]--UDP-N-acetylglucosamine O-acyltransferase, partial [Stellaceae bacterium]|nr:acyl-[acyl-carrier-protein]--UDP-N-acetylglucosamine O-acyltransferase [Stellaceae bacterium]
LFMASAHVAHDCRLGNQVVMANNATLAGHVIVGDHVIFGGLSAVHQFVRVGAHAIISGMTGVRYDVIPFGAVVGDRGYLAGLNIVGMQRRGFSRDEIQAVRNAYQMLFKAENGEFADRLAATEARFSEVGPVREMLDFIRGQSARGITRPEAGEDE